MPEANGIGRLERKKYEKISVFDLGEASRGLSTPGTYYNWKVAKFVMRFDFRSQENRSKIMETVCNVSDFLIVLT